MSCPVIHTSIFEQASPVLDAALRASPAIKTLATCSSVYPTVNHVNMQKAKFLKLEQLNHDHYFPNETNEVSIDATDQVGTYFYTAPEIEKRWPQINEKTIVHHLHRKNLYLAIFEGSNDKKRALQELKKEGCRRALALDSEMRAPKIHWCGIFRERSLGEVHLDPSIT
ncbi:hypothetical protein KSP39_PZI003391 [Platanthera zijinensis]|uniref:Uncharacterized protein n=1 Tax=Platanthera zijinensis TaxID=2320716 RepID=A0AAP0BW08_9ASPA